MSREVLLMRHGLSTANRNRGAGLDIALGASRATLAAEGIHQASESRDVFWNRYGVSTTAEPVAVSTLWRTGLTALEAGFRSIRVYECLDEVEPMGISRQEYKSQLDANRVPDFALAAAERLLDRPPKEEIWICHGGLIAATCYAQGQYMQSLKPGFCEIRQLTIDD